MGKWSIEDETLFGIGQAIRAKTGVSGLLTPAQMKTAIEGITAGGSAPRLQEKTLTITENGSQRISADSGYDGLSSLALTVNVPTGSGTGTAETVEVSVTATGSRQSAIVYLNAEGSIANTMSMYGGTVCLTVPKGSMIVVIDTNALGFSSVNTNLTYEEIPFGIAVLASANDSIDVG